MIDSYVSAASQSDPNGPAGDAGAALLVPNITDTRTQLNNMGLSKTIPVGNADAGAYFNNEVLAAVDYGVRSYIHNVLFENAYIDCSGGFPCV